MIGRSSSCLITRDIVIGGEIAFRNGESVIVEDVAPDPQRPEYKYIVRSATLQKYFQLSENDLTSHLQQSVQEVPRPPEPRMQPTYDPRVPVSPNTQHLASRTAVGAALKPPTNRPRLSWFRWWYIPVAVFVIIAIAVVLFFGTDLLRKEEHSTAQDGTPQGVAQAFWLAALKGDSEATWAMLSKSFQANFKNEAVWAKTQKANNATAKVKAGMTTVIGKTTVTDKTATVSVKIQSGGTEITTQQVSLVKEGGVWKVAVP